MGYSGKTYSGAEHQAGKRRDSGGGVTVFDRLSHESHFTAASRAVIRLSVTDQG
jgi:hypothetical protein